MGGTIHEDSEAGEWNDERTDGGAFDPPGDPFDVTATSLAEGSVGDRTQARIGLDRWLLVDGSDIGSYVELASIGGEAGDLPVQGRTGTDLSYRVCE